MNLKTDEIISQMDDYALKEYTYNILAKDTVVQAVKLLKNKGYGLNVLTASPHKMLDICLERNDMYDLFDNIWSCDDFFTTKSDVNIYHQVAGKLNTTTDNCIFFDDNINALTTAKKSDMTVISVYDESSNGYKEEIKQLCDDYVYKLIDFITQNNIF